MLPDKNIQQFEPFNDYWLLLDTPALLKRKVELEKLEFDLPFFGNKIQGGVPHIYLAAFSQRENDEQAMVDALDKVALGFMPFKIHLKNYAQMNENEIYIDLKEKFPVELLLEKIKQTALPFLIDAKFNPLPRISIARKLQQWQFEKGWQQFKDRHFSATFISSAMTLLKRMEGFKNWQILKIMKFQNQFVLD